MRIEVVTIEGFGALAEERLELAPGMTVVFGPNESGKSTLHAATYAALCGMRRGRGQPRAEDREFAERHRPWDGVSWRVGMLVELADGRRIELSHDLEGRVDSRAFDLALARDVSSEIVFEGAPDGSRWLGFDRRSFVATACVRQAEIAHVLDNANALQDELQRAAASAGRDETAAQAIERLRAFFAENVGRDIRNSTKPLRSAIVRLQGAESAHAEAVRLHDEYLHALAALDERESERDEAAKRLKLAEALEARGEADTKARQLERAAELASKYPAEPAPASGEEELANEVAEALALWESAPPEPDLTGPTIPDLESEIAGLPERPHGDQAPSETVLTAEAAFTAADELVAKHDAAKPAAGLPAAASEELHELADRLAAAPPVEERVRERVDELRSSLSAPARTRRLPLVIAGVFGLAGLAVAASLNVVIGAAMAVAAAVAAAVIAWMARQQPDAAAREALDAAERMLAAQEAAAREVEVRREAALARLAELGLEPDPQKVRTMAMQIAERGEWERRRDQLVRRRDELAQALGDELQARGVASGDDLHAAVAFYKEACREREAQNRAALRRPLLEQQLKERRVAEGQAAARADARAKLSAIAGRLSVHDTEPMDIAVALREWQEQRLRELQQHDTARQEWRELQLLLDGRSLDELRTEAEDAARVAAEAEKDVDPALLAGADPQAERDGLPQLRAELADRAERAHHARGQLEEMASRLPSVAEAEEELAAAQAELGRVRALEETLTRTTQFLEQAQERVHRTMAPVLRETVRGWLPRVVVSRDGETVAERYDDVMVDPETLRVQVRCAEGPWRNAGHLSHGTKEQIYLLLRAALAEHLTTPGEKAPLILDEITAQCDSARRVALLDLLHDLSADRQVVLFTHDEGALAWAEERLELDSGRDRLEIRDPVPVA